MEGAIGMTIFTSILSVIQSQGRNQGVQKIKNS